MQESAEAVLAERFASERPVPTLTLQSFPDFERAVADEPDWLVENLVSDRAWAIFAGEPRSFKTMLALQVAVAVTAGKPVLPGYVVKRPGPVLYVCEEGKGKAVAERIGAMCRQYDTKGTDLHIAWKQGVVINDPTIWDTVRRAVDEVQPALVIIDTFARTFAGNENDSQDIRGATNALDRLVEDAKCAAIVIHHVNKSGSGTTGFKLRGSGSLPAACQSIALFDVDVSAGIKMPRGRTTLESKDSDMRVVHWEFSPDTYLMSLRTDLERPTPELLAKLAARLLAAGTKTSSRALRQAWMDEHELTFGETRWKELVRDAVVAGALQQVGHGPATHYVAVGSQLEFAA